MNSINTFDNNRPYNKFFYYFQEWEKGIRTNSPFTPENFNDVSIKMLTELLILCKMVQEGFVSFTAFKTAFENISGVPYIIF